MFSALLFSGHFACLYCRVTSCCCYGNNTKNPDGRANHCLITIKSSKLGLRVEQIKELKRIIQKVLRYGGRIQKAENVSKKEDSVKYKSSK
ncbi:hypothetical protein TNCV_574271 [Trichonephila clavipes]|nr:hypothetical protein TNCV_574271 [Trichonephila clavipes]